LDAIIAVLAGAVSHELFERTAGCGDQAEIDRDGLVPAQPLESAFLEHAQQLGLRDERGVGDLAEKERAVGELQPAR
jgi:hypothetical protein